MQNLHYDRDRWPGLPLLLVSQGYGLLASLRMKLYRWGLWRTVKVDVPVISIGNLTTGGTGKTPVVIALSQYLEAKGLKVAILSRGYGAKIKSQFHEADHPDYGDEPYLIQQSLKRGKVFVGSNRTYTAQKACETFHPDVILMDDGFQHVRLHRDRNVLLIDGARCFGNGYLLPAGPLRETMKALHRADAILLTKTPTEKIQGRVAQVLASEGLAGQLPVYNCPFEPVAFFNPLEKNDVSLNDLKARQVVLFSGIAQPEDFESMMRDDVRADVLHHLVYTDHENHGEAHIKAIREQLRPDSFLVTTEKDWVKLSAVLPNDLKTNVRVLKIAPVFEWETLLHGFLLERAPV